MMIVNGEFAAFIVAYSFVFFVTIMFTGVNRIIQKVNVTHIVNIKNTEENLLLD